MKDAVHIWNMGCDVMVLRSGEVVENYGSIEEAEFSLTAKGYVKTSSEPRQLGWSIFALDRWERVS